MNVFRHKNRKNKEPSKKDNEHYKANSNKQKLSITESHFKWKTFNYLTFMMIINRL